MNIDKRQLRAWKACTESYKWFLRRFPDGEAEYQDVLNALVEDDRAEDALWLMDHAGPDHDAVLRFDNDVHRKNLFAAGSLVVQGDLIVTDWLCAGGNIEVCGDINVGWGISAEGAIKAKWNIESGLSIEARANVEANHNIKAGCSIEVGGDIKAAWGISAEGDIKAKWNIESGRSISAGEYLEAGRSIISNRSVEAGWGISAGRTIMAGKGFGVYAGLRLKLTDWPSYARVSARSRPKNLLTGCWIEK